jgi:hypothetical protein
MTAPLKRNCKGGPLVSNWRDIKTKVGRGTTYIILVVGHGCDVIASEELLNQGEFDDGK